VALCVLLVGGGAVGATYDDPTVESVDSDWGAVTDEETEIETDVALHNPNAVPVPGVFDVKLRATLNGVVIAEGSESGVGLDSGRNELSLSAAMDNDAIGDWWREHVEDGERSTLSLEATVVGPGGVRRAIPVRNTTVETDLFGPLERDQSRTVSLQGEDLVTIESTSARWGEPGDETTPLQFSASVENRHEQPIDFDAFAYTVQLNNVTVGEGRTTSGLEVEPGASDRLEIDAGIDTERMTDWWPTHVRNNESTTVTVRVDGLVERNGSLERLPLSLYETRLAFETELLDGGQTRVRSLDGTGESGQYASPTVTDTTIDWGRITEEKSAVITTVRVESPDGAAATDLATLSASQFVTINDIPVASNTTRIGSLDSGTDEIRSRVALDNSKVPQWWARHVNNDERSTIRAASSLEADLGTTTVEVRNTTRRNSIETNVLEGFSDETERPVRVGGVEAATIQQTRATWDRATAERSPIELDVTVRNNVPVPVSIEELQYRMEMNDVTVGDGTAPESYTLAAGETRRMTFTIVVDSQRMDEWWVSHIRNGERTRTSVDISAQVAGAGVRSRVDLGDSIETQGIRTDVLGGLSEDRSGSNR
jgi:LEA14-like dessication related protein